MFEHAILLTLRHQLVHCHAGLLCKGRGLKGKLSHLATALL